MPDRRCFRLFLMGAAAFASLSPSKADASEQATSSATPDTLSADITSWGRTVSHWELHADGQYVQWEQDFHTSEIKNRVSVNKGRETYDKALSIVASMTGLSDIGCTDAPTDGPSVEYRFPNGGTLNFYLGCYSSRRKPDIQKLWDVETQLYSLIPWIR